MVDNLIHKLCNPISVIFSQSYNFKCFKLFISDIINNPLSFINVKLLNNNVFKLINNDIVLIPSLLINCLIFLLLFICNTCKLFLISLLFNKFNNSKSVN